MAPTFARAVSYFARKGNCFVAGTPVQMADGTTKPIEQVKVGDWVKSRNPKTGQTEAKRVLQTTVRQTDQVLTLALTDPKTGHQEVITTTGEHPFYVEGQGFVKAGDLGIGTSIVTRAGPTLTLSHLTWQTTAQSNGLLLDGSTHEGGYTQSGYTVYNLIVDADHTYFVGTTGGGAWVHNVDCLRLQYVGRTPGKASKTGKEVIDRMAGEGKIRDTDAGLEVYHEPTDSWHPIGSTDMGHLHDAVTYWNNEGIQHGAKAPEVRKWMLNSKNYELEPTSINRSRGAKSKETYRKP